MTSRVITKMTISILAILLVFTGSALAGPPLVCHALQIGNAKTLPWVDLNYRKGSGNYNTSNLTRDTLAILDSDKSVLVHMETLRRATLYARQDPNAAKELLTRLHARAENSDANGHPDAMAWFDLGYIAETYKQWAVKGDPNPANGLDGYGWVKKAIRLKGQDAEMEFAAAMITLSGPESEHRAHAQKAIDGAKGDPLLAQNLSNNFNRQTVSELLISGDR